MKQAGLVLYQLTNSLLSLHNRAVYSIHMSDIILCRLYDDNSNSKDDVNNTTLKLCLLPHTQEVIVSIINLYIFYFILT